MGSSQSKGKYGGNWENFLHYLDVDIPYNSSTGDRYAKVVPGKPLLDYFALLKGEKLEEIHIFKYPLTNFGIFGDWHEFVIIGSTSWWWSFDKFDTGIWVQRSKKYSNVQQFHDGSRRGEGRQISNEGRPWVNLRSFGDTIYDILMWINGNQIITEGYHWSANNCHYFASELYEAVARNNGTPKNLANRNRERMTY